MEVLQVLKYSINEERRERDRRRGLVARYDSSESAGADSNTVLLVATEHGAPGEDPPEVDDDNFSPGRMSDVLQEMREACPDIDMSPNISFES